MIFEILFLVSDWICHVTPPQTSQHSGVNLGVLYEGGGVHNTDIPGLLGVVDRGRRIIDYIVELTLQV